MARSPRAVKPTSPRTVKVTLTLPAELAQRLGVAAEMRFCSKSQVAEEILGPSLRRWRLPSTVDGPAHENGPLPRVVSGEEAA